MKLPLDQILHGTCLDVLRTLPDASIDSVVADVPYGLGNKEPTPDDIFMYVLGCTLDTGGDFMGRDWEIPSVAVWREVFRVLKPGGHVLSFGGTRTFDLISIGIRMAGFESRDTIGREYPVLRWLQGQGMPKSHNVSAAIDKKLGKKREVVGYRPVAYPDTPSGYTSFSANCTARKGGIWNESTGEAYHGRPVTAPVSDEAKQWAGWGSGLKPSWEPILVFRKPLEGTLASNVLKYGTGGLNIDATRVRHASKADFEAHKKGVDAVRAKGGSRDASWKNASDLSGANEVTAAGRWPNNVLLEHSEQCRKVGTKVVKGITGGTAAPVRRKAIYSEAGGYNTQGSEQLPVKGYSEEDGSEAVEAWECADGCPVRALDKQSGERLSTLTGRADPNGSHEHPGTEMNPNSTFLGERTHLSRVYADAGGASRFFTQLDGAAWECAEGCPVKELHEQGVAMGSHAAGNKGETNHVSGKGYGGAFKPMTNNPDYHADEGGVDRFFAQFEAEGEVPFKYIAKANRKEAGCGEFEVQHVTLKPLALMRWLVRLVTPKGGVVLDPYCGSGSTCHAAVLEEMHFIGIERDEKNHAEAVKRLEIVLRRDQERKDEEETFAFAMGRTS